LKFTAISGLLFLRIPILLIILYAFTTDDKTFQFPPPGLTTEWFAVAWERNDIHDALMLSLKSSFLATGISLILGTLSAAALYRFQFFG
jgi:putative spermidine/putrescine transport system permease protein